MLSLTTLITFAAAVAVFAVTPGPNVLFVLSRSVGQGRRAGVASVLGLILGWYGHAFATAIGLAALVREVPWSYDVVRAIGAAYLLYLAWQAWRGTGAFALDPTRQGSSDLWRIARDALITNLTNPKTALFFLALLPQFVAPERGPVMAQVLVLATVYSVIAAGILLLLVQAAGRIGEWLSRHPKIILWQQRAMATIMAGLALRLAFDIRR
jgi:threonine/homoserine/homoserine lactone efflux protein